MADEDRVQRRIEFIVDQQAQFTTDIAELKDGIGQLKDVVTRLANVSLQRIENLENKVSALADAQIKTEENISALAQAQAQSEERLNAFIDVVERYITKERNGDTEGQG